ncbi:MAG: hypothetical protein RLZZ455_1224, partial [Candidatus Parcubacteria bacterium]
MVSESSAPGAETVTRLFVADRVTSYPVEYAVAQLVVFVPAVVVGSEGSAAIYCGTIAA